MAETNFRLIFLLNIFTYLSTISTVYGQCTIHARDEQTQQNYANVLKSSSTTIVAATLVFCQQNAPDKSGWKMYDPKRWNIPTGNTGKLILTSHPDIAFYSLGFSIVGMENLEITITSEPNNCLNTISEDNFTQSMINLFSSGLKSSGNQSTMDLPDEAMICREEAMINEKKVTFKQICCQGNGVCSEIQPNVWQNVLFYTITFLGSIAFLYSINLVPGYFYRSKYDYRIYYLDSESPSTFDVIDNTSDDVDTDAVFDKQALQQEKKGITRMMSLADIVKGGTYKIKGLWIKAPNVRLVTKSHMPITLPIFLYQRIIKCRCYTYRGRTNLITRTLHTLSGNRVNRRSSDNKEDDFTIGMCCDMPICNPPKGNFKLGAPSWRTVLQITSAIISTVLFLIPWILVYALHDVLPEGRRGTYAYENGLIYTPPAYAFNIFRFAHSTVPGLSLFAITIYVICVSIASIILAVDEDQRQYVGKKTRTTLRQASQKRLAKGVKISVVLLLPFKVLRNYGLLALLIWPFWLLIICPLTILIAVFAYTPTIHVFLKLLVSFVIDIVDIFKTRECLTNWRSAIPRFVLYVALIYVLFVVNFLLHAFALLVVNVLAYTLAGIIITANATFKIVSFVLFVSLNIYDTFQSVEKRYMVFNEKLHSLLLSKTKDQIKRIARHESNDQPNKAIRIKTEMENENKEHEGTRSLWDKMFISDENRIMLKTESVIQFLDKNDKLFLSEKFFFQACYMDYYGCPGDFSSNLLIASRNVLLIILFLAFVMITLRAFGVLDVDSNSGLLITLVAGLLPTLIKRFFSKPFPELSLDVNDYNFQNKLGDLIHTFSEYWEIVDLDIEEVVPSGEAESTEERRSNFWLRLGPNTAVELSVGRSNNNGAPEEEIGQSDDIEMNVVN